MGSRVRLSLSTSTTSLARSVPKPGTKLFYLNDYSCTFCAEAENRRIGEWSTENGERRTEIGERRTGERKNGRSENGERRTGERRTERQNGERRTGAREH